MSAFNLLFAVLVLMVPVWFICVSRLSRRLHELHPAKYEQMHLAEMWPRDITGWIGRFDNTRAVFALLRFLFRREDLALHDAAISSLSTFMRMFLLAYVGVFLALVFAMFNPGNMSRLGRASSVDGAPSRDYQLRKEVSDLYRMQKWSEAIALYDELVRGSEEDAGLYYWRGMAHWQLGHADLALQDFRRVIELEPSNFEAHRNADRILSKQRRWNDVLEIWDPYIAANPTNAEAYFERGGTNYHKGDRAAARADAAKACQLGKSEACTWQQRLR